MYAKCGSPERDSANNCGITACMICYPRTNPIDMNFVLKDEQGTTHKYVSYTDGLRDLSKMSHVTKEMGVYYWIVPN